jgi:hypothetical protein
MSQTMTANTRTASVKSQANTSAKRLLMSVKLELLTLPGTRLWKTRAAPTQKTLDIPADRQGDLFHAPGMLIARDADGREVASVPVAAVAFWRAHPGVSDG